VVREGSGELQQIATEMADRVSADRGMVETLGHALGSLSSSMRRALTSEELQSAAAILGSASAQASDRLGALEKLFTASIERIGDLKEKLTKAEQDATRDALTGLANRRSFDADLLRAARQATEDNSALSLVILDVDHFKQFNDTHGHALGDQVLRLIAGVLTEHTKGRDTAARYGDEEFAIILPETALHGGVTVAEQIRTILERRPIINRVSGQRLGLATCSIGVAQYRPGEPVGELVNRADQLLYRAKREGRNTVRAEDPVASGYAAQASG
jgi:diguanylate cyclase